MRDSLFAIVVTFILGIGLGIAGGYIYYKREVAEASEIKKQNIIYQDSLKQLEKIFVGRLLESGHQQALLQKQIKEEREFRDSLQVTINQERVKTAAEIKKLKTSTVKELEDEAEIAFRTRDADHQ